MRLVSACTDGQMRAGVIDGDEVVLLPYRDVGETLREQDWATRVPQLDGERVALSALELAPVVPHPEKIICAGLNYETHADEANLSIPDYPPLFAKFWRSLIGPSDNIQLPSNSDCVDWEIELAVVIGSSARFVDEAGGVAAIAGYTVMNDVSMRDWQLRTSEFLQGKTFEASSPFGPELVTLDEFDNPEALQLSCEVDGVTRQLASTADMVVTPGQLVAYISQFITLVPGDVIATGTPGGVGGAMVPPVYLRDGQIVRSWIEGIGEMMNRCTLQQDAPSLAKAVE
jgi:acylpyruvate hydrolase